MLLSYFNVENLMQDKQNFIYNRRHRNLVSGFSKVVCFGVGDILEVIYFKGDIPFIFEGVCIILRKKCLKSPDVTFIIRNVVLGVGIEMGFSYYVNRVYNFTLNDYKRKVNSTRRAKMIYIRNRLNRESRVK